MRRREVLRAGFISSMIGFSGCSSSDQSNPTQNTSKSNTSTRSPSTPTETRTARENPDVIYVDVNRGDDDAIGTRDSPVRTIQEGVNRAQPGQSVSIGPGVHRVSRPIRTVRDGSAGEPITITGPSEAVIRPVHSANRFSSLIRIGHNHVHLHGLSFDGLADSNRGDEIGQYKVTAVIRIRPPSDTSDYLEDIVVKPTTVGNSYWGLINHTRANHVEIGEFRVAGTAGAGYVVTGDENRHAGEIVYLGTPPSAVLENVNPNWGIDESHDIHVHHIDNSEGHPHSEIVNTKLGTYDVRIEYCTDGGGSQHTDPYPVASINLQSYSATVRWCRLRDGDGHGVHVNSGAEGALESIEDPPLTREIAGTGHRVYGNEIRRFGADAVAYTMTTPGEQHTVCGNTIKGPTQGSPSEGCPGDIPGGDGVGHLGGESPWSLT